MGRINSVIIIMKRGRLLSRAVVFLRHWLGGGEFTVVRMAFKGQCCR